MSGTDFDHLTALGTPTIGNPVLSSGSHGHLPTHMFILTHIYIYTHI